MLDFLYRTKKMTHDYITYEDFNKTTGKDVKSIYFRQSIDKINERVEKEVGVISQVIGIKPKDKGKEKETNQYRWKIKK